MNPGGGQPNMAQLMKQAQQMQQQMATAQQELARTEVSGSAGGGLVSVTMTGAGELLAVRIDPTAIDPDDAEGSAEIVADLVVAAVRDASRAAHEVAEQTMAPVTGGMGGLGLPGG